MRTDDLLALGTISVGAFAGLALSLAVVESSPFSSHEAVDIPAVASPLPQTSRSDRPIVDFAIIRDGWEPVAGPEGPEIGWAPDLDRLRHHPGR